MVLTLAASHLFPKTYFSNLFPTSTTQGIRSSPHCKACHICFLRQDNGPPLALSLGNQRAKLYNSSKTGFSLGPLWYPSYILDESFQQVPLLKDSFSLKWNSYIFNLSWVLILERRGSSQLKHRQFNSVIIQGVLSTYCTYGTVLGAKDKSRIEVFLKEKNKSV